MFDIHHQCDDFVVIDKHANVSVHKDDGETMLLHEVAKKLDVEKLYLVHRLDKMTSGLLLLAKSSESASQLAKLFADRKIEKYYLAIGEGKPKKKQGLISGDMQRSRRSSWKLMKSRQNPAVTQFFSKPGSPGQRFFLCRPYSGKTHQIRVALKSVGSAIVGDPIYNTASAADRGYLHAYALKFTLNDIDYCFVCRPEQGQLWQSDIADSVLEQWSSPWQLNWPKIK
ncbi:TIGR01621 family pseudouridine synthase [Vibrio sp. SCSIO 43137]|uniref:TIGR01621 family pseudouridine synthase n=1 Tax=Vibrio sp. SCSIO 43137 TaxID=3021011 RepID=UPI002306DF34|nr:TIGR01621 family pseudouridine synthase [Vibrio sp. SCSIO 43137]WCE28526.1 TIGR01621 family pseudouridine synthase [Vibrio sp. SCSIO 43137]